MKQAEHTVSDDKALRIINQARSAIGANGANGADHPGETTEQAASVQWPAPMADEAYYGLAGQIVRAIEPHSETDPAMLLIQLLAGFGNLIGRNAYFQVEATRHATNINAVIVGDTSKGRKGTSWDHVRRLLGAVDEDWAATRIQSGLSTGEGLTWAVRDPIYEAKNGQSTMVDAGAQDKRLLIVEPEFARVLQVCERESNTLSATIRQAWDTGELRTLTKKAAAKATGAHISIIAHITCEELRKLLSETQSANGFANRFLWVCGKRSKYLPEGGNIESVDFAPMMRALSDAANFARHVERLHRDEEARALWLDMYVSLSDGKPGLLGAVTGRAEAQAVRLSMLYALLDASNVIRLPHLAAALAIVHYVTASARFVWGDALGNGVADEILGALRGSEHGLTRSDISSGLFSRNKTATHINVALRFLASRGLARCEREETSGRPVERWFANSPSPPRNSV